VKQQRFDLDIAPSTITSEAVYLGPRTTRRQAMAVLGGWAGLGEAGLGYAQAATQAPLMQVVKSPFSVLESVTPQEIATTKTRFRELEPEIEKNGQGFATSPWQVSVEGECNKPRTFDLDELLRLAPFEERIYRMLCNEGFLHVVPYLGYSLSRLLAKVEPTGNAKFLEMTSVMRPTQLPGQREVTYIPWPYVEGLRIDEAMHPLTLVALGAYGQILPKGLGAPIAIRAPWKFGTKSPKAVVKLRLTEKQPATIWNSRYPKYHSFWGNINPAGATNFLGQGQQERKYGDLMKKPTPLYNGYAEHVASLYRGMNLAEMY
jgi:methionine sulfoxide reductase catalytic subunit